MVYMKCPKWWIAVAIVVGLTSLSPTLAFAKLIAVANSLNRCHTSQLSVSFRPGEPGAGQRYATLVLTNHSKTCSVYGYVGIQLLNAQRLPLPTNVVRNRTQPPRQVVLSPGQSAFSALHWTVVNGPGEPSDRQCEPTPSYIEVTPPDEMDFLLTRWDGGYVCLHGRIDTGPLVSMGNQ